MNKNNICSLLFLCLLFPLGINANNASPKWTMEFYAGAFEPEDENWSTYYGSSKMPQVGFSIAYRIFNVLDIGTNISYGRDQGKGDLPLNNLIAGDVVHEMLPVELYLLFRARFTEGQWLVPYVGGGYTRFAYRQEVKGQDTVKGSVDGNHFRAGLQFLLDPLDEKSAQEIYRGFGVINSYLYLEYKQTEAEADKIKIGGTSYNMGLMLEF